MFFATATDHPAFFLRLHFIIGFDGGSRKKVRPLTFTRRAGGHESMNKIQRRLEAFQHTYRAQRIKTVSPTSSSWLIGRSSSRTSWRALTRNYGIDAVKVYDKTGLIWSSRPADLRKEAAADAFVIEALDRFSRTGLWS